MISVTPSELKVKINKGKRIYVVPLDKRIYGIDYCVPEMLTLQSGVQFKEKEWNSLIVKLIQYLQLNEKKRVK